MKAPLGPAKTPVVQVGSEPSLDRTVRIEHDRIRLTKAVFVHATVAIVIIGWLVWRIVHPLRTPAPIGSSAVTWIWPLLQPAHAMSWFGFSAIAFAAFIAVLRMLRFLFQLQDGNPAMILSPRGLSLKPRLHSEMALIPWSAIHGFKAAKLKKTHYIALKVDNLQRYAPHFSLFGHWRDLNERKSSANDLRFSTPMSAAAFANLETLLQRYIAKYGRADAVIKKSRRRILSLFHRPRAR